MQTKITLTSSDNKISLRYMDNQFDLLDEYENYRISIDDESTLRELVQMIEEILQLKNKRDW